MKKEMNLEDIEHGVHWNSEEKFEMLPVMMATLCLPTVRVLGKPIGISIIIQDNEHGQLNTVAQIPNDKSPAHVHIYEGKLKEKREIFQINITGPCPSTKDNVMIYKQNKKINSRFSESDIKEKFYNWAIEIYVNPISKKMTDDNNWFHAQTSWIEMNPELKVVNKFTKNRRIK
jgi:hypothetical protein